MKIQQIKLPAFILLAAALFFSCRKSPNQKPSQPPSQAPDGWTRIATTAGLRIFSLETADNVIYAGSNTGVIYTSMDGGLQWSALNPVKPGAYIMAIAVFNSKLYAGTYDEGIFVSSDHGKTWTKEEFVFPPVSSFAVWNNRLYCSSSFEGVYVLDETNGSWMIFDSKGQPTNYSLDVEKVIPAGESLLSAQGPNGTFYSYKPAAKQWQEGYYSGNIVAGSYASDMIYDQATIFAAGNFHGPAIIRSTDGGANWAFDTVGLKRFRGAAGELLAEQWARFVYAGSKKYYSLFNTGSGTWIQQKDRPSPVGKTWVANTAFLPLDGMTYAIRELNGKLFLATDEGIYMKGM